MQLKGESLVPRKSAKYQQGMNIVLRLPDGNAGEAAAPQFFNINGQAETLLDFEDDINPLVQDLAKKWSQRRNDLAAEQHDAQNRKATLDIQIRDFEEQKRKIRSKSEIKSENEVFMSTETLFLKDQLAKSQDKLEGLNAEYKSNCQTCEQLTRQEATAIQKGAEMEEELRMLESKSSAELVQMSNLNREAMQEMKRWKQQAEGPNGLLRKMQEDTAECLQSIRASAYFLQEGQGEDPDAQHAEANEV